MHKNFVIRTVMVVILIISVPVSSLAADCQQSTTMGEVDAGLKHHTTGWMLAGVGSGFLLGLIGTGVITGVSLLSNPIPVIPEQSGYEITCYKTGYTRTARKKNILTALGGGLVGTAVWMVVYNNIKK